MNRVTGLIKKSKVTLTGKWRPGLSETDEQGQVVATVVSQDEKGAVIEVICKCGEHIQLFCDYAGAEQQALAAPQQGA